MLYYFVLGMFFELAVKSLLVLVLCSFIRWPLGRNNESLADLKIESSEDPISRASVLLLTQLLTLLITAFFFVFPSCFISRFLKFEIVCFSGSFKKWHRQFAIDVHRKNIFEKYEQITIRF